MPDMQRFPRSNLPAGWQQFCPEAPWSGVDVAHYCIEENDSEYSFDSVFNFSLVIKPPAICQLMVKGRWVDANLGAGTVTFDPPSKNNRVRWLGGFEAVNVAIDEKWIFGEEESRFSKLLRLSGAKNAFRDGVIAQLICDIKLDCLKGAPQGLLFTEALAQSLLFRYSAINETFPRSRREDRRTKSIYTAIDFMRANLDKALSIEEIIHVSAFDGSVFAFQRAFKRHTELTPHVYLLSARLELARELLRSNKQSITEIALACGFSNLSHFSDAYRRRWGESPSNSRSA
jgi:AraC family transcriptional regulator